VGVLGQQCHVDADGQLEVLEPGPSIRRLLTRDYLCCDIGSAPAELIMTSDAAAAAAIQVLDTKLFVPRLPDPLVHGRTSPIACTPAPIGSSLSCLHPQAPARPRSC
jgi:hypothetical protein